MSDMVLNPEQFTVRPATEAQAIQNGKACFEVTDWRAGMSWEAFKAFGEMEQSKAEYAKDQRAICWVLVRRDDFDGEIYSALETHRTKCFIKNKGQNQVQDGWVYEITAVVTPHKHRGRGYATHLIRLLHYILTSSPALDTYRPISQVIPPFPNSWGQSPPTISQELAPYVPRAEGSILWSDVPMRVYERCTLGLDGRGFQSREDWGHTLIWKLHDGQPEDRGDWEYIWEFDMADIYPIVSANSEQRLAQVPTTNRTVFLCDPASPGTLTMLPVRGSFGPQPSWRTRAIPFGVRFKPTKGRGWENEAIVLFGLCNYMAPPRLCVTYMQHLTAEMLPSLLEALDGVVRFSGAPWTEGEVWGLDPASDVVKAWEGMEGRDVVLSTRSGEESKAHVLGVCWYSGEEVDVADTQMWAWV
ncbi:hypothetical protein IAR50_006771 [Cryptococcus sp. DSM 104548]